MIFIRVSIVFYLMLSLGFGCRSSNVSKNTQLQGKSSTDTSPVSSKLSHATTIKENASYVHAVVDTVVMLGSIDYRAEVRIKDVMPTETVPSFAEAGQSISITPQYVLNDSGSVDSLNARNKALLELRLIKPGSIIGGIISLNEKGKWVLLKVEYP